MKAIVHHGEKGLAGVSFTDNMEDTQPDKGQVKVRLKTAGLNHRDLLVLNRRGENDPPVILGSDGAGIVESVGEGVTSVKSGDEVIINPGLGWKEKSDSPPPGFQILGVPSHGTFAETIIVPSENIEKKPEMLSWDEAGVLPLGALTAYRVLFTRAKIKKGDTVFIPGIGSGVATFLLLFAKAVGAKVIVTSRSNEKLQKAKELGADIAIDSNSDWSEELSGQTVDIVIESVGAATFDNSLSVLRPGGTIVVFGASAGDEIKLDIRQFFYGQYNLLGSTMGSADEFKEMLEFVETHQIKPVIDRSFALEETTQALRHMDQAMQFGKIVIKMED